MGNTIGCSCSLPEEPKKKGRQKCEVYSRVVGYMRPIQQWNKGKQQEFKDRKNFKLMIA